MGFNSVYQSLKELFPQVDARLLKAVAIEHSKDPDAAVESVLTEVLPYVVDKSNAQTSCVKNNGKAVETVVSVAGDNANGFSLWNHGGHNFDNDALSSSFYDAKDNDEPLSGNLTNEELILFIRCGETASKSEEAEKLSASSDLGDSCEDNCNQEFVLHDDVSVVPTQDRGTDLPVMKASVSSSSVVSVKGGDADVGLGNTGDVQLACTIGVSSGNSELAPLVDSLIKQPYMGCNLVDSEVSTGSASKEQPQVGGLTFNGHRAAETAMAVAKHVRDTDLLHEFPQSDVAAESEALPCTIVTRSGQICSVNLLEDIIEEARNYKDTVFTAMESVLSLMEEVELQEKEAGQAKEAAARGGFDILEKVEEIKKMLKHAKEANELHAGEVYGEKSILATEVRELQARLFSLSDEKDKSLSVLDEMRRSLEERLAVAEQQRTAAEQELFGKQEKARGALREQELIMDKVVQESKVLQQEAEENAKLRDFLMEKGAVVDVLQGEISVLCQDVKVLKENFANNYSLSKPVSIEQTSCRLASSNSSVKSVGSLKSSASLGRTASMKSTTSLKSSVSDPTTEQMDFPESPARMSRASSLDCQSPKSNVREEASRHGAGAQNPLLDDDWELCDSI